MQDPFDLSFERCAAVCMSMRRRERTLHFTDALLVHEQGDSLFQRVRAGKGAARPPRT